MMVADVIVEWARTRGGGRKDERDDDRVAEPGVRVGVRVEADEYERVGVDVEDDGRDSDNDEDEGDGEGEGCAVKSAAAV